MEALDYLRRRSRSGHRQSLAAGFLLAVAFLACGAQAWLPTADAQPDSARPLATGHAGADEALPGEDPPEVDSVRAPARPPVKEQAARRLEVGSSGRVTGLSRPTRPPLVPRKQEPPALSAAPRSPELRRPLGPPGATKTGPLARSAPRAEPVRLPSPEPELPAASPSRQERTIVRALPPVIEPPPVAREQEVLPARPALPESPPNRQPQEVATAQPMLIQPEPGPEPSALMRMPGRELLAPSALDLRRLRRTVAREGSQLTIGPSSAEGKPDGATTVAATPQEVRAGPVRLSQPDEKAAQSRPVRLPPVLAQPAAMPPVRLPPLAAETPEPRPVRLPPVDPVVAARPAVSPEPEPRPAEPAGEAVVVTDDVPPPRRDPLPPAWQQAVGKDSSDAAKPTPVAAPERPPQKEPASPPVVAQKEPASPPVVARREAVAAGPLRLTLKFPPPPKTSSGPQPDRPVVAMARLAPKAADPKADLDQSTPGADGEEGVAFASDSAETPQQPLQLTIKIPPRDAKPGEGTKQAADSGANR